MNAYQTMTGTAVWFTAANQVETRQQEVVGPGPAQLRVAAVCSLLSPGTELRILRGEVSPDTPLGLETCEGSFAFPVKYGYQVVGRVTDVGSDVPLAPGQMVFARHPHQDHFLMRYDPELVIPLPETLAPESAAFSNLMSVALNALLDMPVRPGDEVAVFGLGPVGLFCAMLAARTARRVWAIDPNESRRERASSLANVIPLSPDEAAEAIRAGTHNRGVDIAFEASGAPPAFQQALGVLGTEGSLVSISYFGNRQVELRLAPEFHFNRLRVISSQAGIIGSGLQPRWDRMRRMQVAWEALQSIDCSSLITHRFSLADAAEAYRVLGDGRDAFGVLLEYSSDS